MPDTIKYFMWPYQPHFRISQSTQSERLFKRLDKDFEPEVFIVGILMDDRNDRHPACVEPEKNFWIHSTDFNSILDDAKTMVPEYPESQMIQSHSVAQKREYDGMFKRAIRDAILKLVNAHSEKPKQMQYFASYPVEINGYMVSIILGLQESVINRYPRLLIDRVYLHKYRSYPVSTSLIEAVVFEYLIDAASELLKPDPGEDFCYYSKSKDEILRAGGSRLIRTAGSKIDIYNNQGNGEFLIYDRLNQISALKYEQMIGSGKIVFTRKDHPDLNKKISFVNPIQIENHRALRKLLELTSDDCFIHMNAKEAWGLVSCESYSGEKEDLYEIEILGYHYWCLKHARKTLMLVQDGLPFLPSPKVDENKLRKDIPRIFKEYSYDLELLISLIKEAEREKHGTMLVISVNAGSETERLCNQAICLEPVVLTPTLLKQLTPIDGAVLVDPLGVCYGIGVILDGIATKSGSLARGARFNSAIRYVETQTESMECMCMAVVVSEDGGIDYFPNYVP